MTEINESTKQQIIEYLGKNGPSFLGNVIKELKLSYINGTNHINFLVTRGIVKHSDSPLLFELDFKSK